MTAATLTGTGNFFEDFPVGKAFRHWRGKTVTDLETQTLATLVMNTANGHYNADVMRDGEFGVPIAFGGIVASIVYGIASQDTAEQAVAEEGIDLIRFTAPTKTGDTLYVTTEVLEAGDGTDDATGRVTFEHVGTNERGDVVCRMRRRVLLRRRPNGEG